MVNFTDTTLVTTDPTEPCRMLFFTNGVVNNFNDTSVLPALANTTYPQEGQTIAAIVRGFVLEYRAPVAVTGASCSPYIMAGTGYVTYERLTQGANLKEYKLYKPNQPIFRQVDNSAYGLGKGTGLFGVSNIASYGANDDIYYFMWGELLLDKPSSVVYPTAPQPVDVKRLLGWPRV